jgi:hypothetical protein
MSLCGIKSDKSYHVHEEEDFEGHKATNPIDFTPCGGNSGQIPCSQCRIKSLFYFLNEFRNLRVSFFNDNALYLW